MRTDSGPGEPLFVVAMAIAVLPGLLLLQVMTVAIQEYLANPSNELMPLFGLFTWVGAAIVITFGGSSKN